jgi:carbon-monoxide dehydrogenase large subunit
MTNVADQQMLSDAVDRSVGPEAAPDGNPWMGRSVQRLEDEHLLTGRSTFIANLDLEGALVARFVTSIHAHALITGIDTSAAAGAPGVVDVVTAADLDLAPTPGLPDDTVRPILATDRVRFVGEPIVAIVATSTAAAADAVELVEVSYEPLEPVVDPATAAASESVLFPDLGTNEVVTATGPGENQPIDFSGFEVVATGELLNQRLAPCPLETRAAASVWTDDGRLLHYAACQGAHPIQKGLAAYYGLDDDAVRVVTQDVGGSFGAKARAYPEDLLLPELARRTGRPVRWIPTRSEDMSGLGHSRAQIQRVTVGGDRDGTIRALSVHLTADLGAYPVTGGALARNTGMILPGPYKIDQVFWELSAVVTNTTPLAAYRGAGRPEAGALLDRAVDLFAAEVGLDPLEVRRKNLRRSDEMPWTNPTGLTYDSGDYVEALEKAVAEVGYDDIKAAQARARQDGDAGQPLVGVGLSVFIDRTAGIPSPEYGALELRPDGSFRILTGSSPYGQGHYTTWAMLVSERTGVPIDQIEVFHGDTDVVPRGGITGGSRSAQRAGSAVALATEELVELARGRAADLLEAAVGDVVLDLARAQFHVAGAPGAATVGWVEIAAQLAAEEADNDDYVLKCESDFLGEGATVPYGAYAAVVAVDPETGHVELTRLVTVDDAGVVINPMIVFGQVHGGVGQGVGQALYEEFVYDDRGNPITATFLDYGFPSAAEMPSFDCFLSQTPSPNNPLGAKGIAESGTIGAVPAVQNAVVDALAHLGVRHLDLPVTPQRVWVALNEAAGS